MAQAQLGHGVAKGHCFDHERARDGAEEGLLGTRVHISCQHCMGADCSGHGFTSAVSIVWGLTARDAGPHQLSALYGG